MSFFVNVEAVQGNLQSNDFVYLLLRCAQQKTGRQLEKSSFERLPLDNVAIVCVLLLIFLLYFFLNQGVSWRAGNGTL